jgi:pentatricopeptide repeat protein
MAAMAPGKVQLNIFGWNKKLEKYVNAGQPEKALQLFQQLQQQEGMSPDSFTFVPVLNACASLRAGVFMNRLLKAVMSQMSLLGTALLICMQNVGALRMLGQCSTRCPA